MQDHIDRLLQELAHYAAGGDVHPHVEQMARELAEHHAKGGEAYKYPQDDALEQARLNAIRLLGLHENNTPHERARAMGFDVGNPVYHSSLDDVKEFTPHGKFMGHKGVSGTSVTDNSEMANRYLDRYGEMGFVDGVPDQHFSKNVMPLLIRKGKSLESDVSPFTSNIRMGHPLPDNYRNPMKNQGIDTLITPDSISRRGGVKHSDAKNAIRGHELITADPSQLRSRFAAFDPARAHEAGLNYADGGSVEPSHDDMLAHIMLYKADGGSVRHEPTEIGVDEAPGMVVKRYMPAGVSEGQGNIPVGGVDLNQGQPGQQFAPEQPPQGAPGQPPTGMPPTGPQAPAGPPSNILNMTRQGQAMSAMKAPVPAPMAPAQMAKPVAPPNPSPLIKNGMARMAEGGIVNEKHEKNRMEFLRGSQVPERVYHGTGNLENMESFDPEQTGKGIDQLGSGFYFTNKPETANSYTGSVSPSTPKGATKLGGDTSPGVIAAHLAIKKPLRVGPEGRHLGDTDVDLTHMQVKRIMNMAPNIKHRDKSPLADHVDTSRGVSPAMIHDVAKYYTGSSLHTLENDMFKNDPTAYREALHKVLGYDGVIKDFGNGEKHYVAWFPHQIKSAIGNRGTYDTNSDKITRKEGGSVKPVVHGIIKEQVTVIPDLAAMKRALMKAKR